MKILKRVLLGFLLAVVGLVLFLAISVAVDFAVGAERINAVTNTTLPGVNGGPDVRAYGFEIQDHHIHFRGVCATCRTALAKLALRPALRTKPSTAAARRRVKLRSSTKQRRNKT